MSRQFCPLEVLLVPISCAPETFLALWRRENFLFLQENECLKPSENHCSQSAHVYKTKANDRCDDWFIVCTSCGSESYQFIVCMSCGSESYQFIVCMSCGSESYQSIVCMSYGSESHQLTVTVHSLLSTQYNISTVHLVFISDSFPSGFPARTLYTPLPSRIRATCPAHLILYLITPNKI